MITTNNKAFWPSAVLFFCFFFLFLRTAISWSSTICSSELMISSWTRDLLLLIDGSYLTGVLNLFCRIIFLLPSEKDRNQQMTKSLKFYVSALAISLFGAISNSVILLDNGGGVCLDSFGVKTHVIHWANLLVTSPLIMFVALTADGQLNHQSIAVLASQLLSYVSVAALQVISDPSTSKCLIGTALVLMIPTVHCVLTAYRKYRAIALKNDPLTQSNRIISPSDAQDFVTATRKLLLLTTISCSILMLYVFYFLKMLSFLNDDVFFTLLIIQELGCRMVFISISIYSHTEMVYPVAIAVGQEKVIQETRRTLLRYLFHEIRVPLNSIAMAVDLLMPEEKDKLLSRSSSSEIRRYQDNTSKSEAMNNRSKKSTDAYYEPSSSDDDDDGTASGSVSADYNANEHTESDPLFESDTSTEAGTGALGAADVKITSAPDVKVEVPVPKKVPSLTLPLFILAPNGLADQHMNASDAGALEAKKVEPTSMSLMTPVAARKCSFSASTFINNTVENSSSNHTSNNDKKGTDDEEGEDFASTLAMIRESVDTINDTLNDVMALQQLEDKQLTLIRKPFSIHQLFTVLGDSFHDMLSDYNVKLVCHISDKLPADGGVMGDKIRLRHVLAHLISNAIHFSNSDGVITLSASIVDEPRDNALPAFPRLGKALVSPSKRPVRVKFTVTDNGCGISTKRQGQNIFLPFRVLKTDEGSIKSQANSGKYSSSSKVDDGSSDKTCIAGMIGTPRKDPTGYRRGSGLGLPVCKEIVSMHGGEINYTSEEGLGSVFNVTIPFDIVEPSAASFRRVRSTKSVHSNSSNDSNGHGNSFHSKTEGKRDSSHVDSCDPLLLRKQTFSPFPAVRGMSIASDGGKTRHYPLESHLSVITLPKEFKHSPFATPESPHNFELFKSRSASEALEGTSPKRSSSIPRAVEPIRASSLKSMKALLSSNSLKLETNNNYGNSSNNNASSSSSRSLLDMSFTHGDGVSGSPDRSAPPQPCVSPPMLTSRTEALVKREFPVPIGRTTSSSSTSSSCAAVSTATAGSSIAHITGSPLTGSPNRPGHRAVKSEVPVLSTALAFPDTSSTPGRACGIAATHSLNNIQSLVDATATGPPSLETFIASLNCLIVDDVGSNRKLLSMVVKKKGIRRITLAENGQEAIDKVQAAEAENRPFDIIFMDNNMPVKTGVEASTEIRANGYRNTIIGITGNCMLDELAELTDAGADLAVTKPMGDGLLSALFAHLYAHGVASRNPQKFQYLNGVLSLVG